MPRLHVNINRELAPYFGGIKAQRGGGSDRSDVVVGALKAYSPAMHVETLAQTVSVPEVAGDWTYWPSEQPEGERQTRSLTTKRSKRQSHDCTAMRGPCWAGH